MKLAETARKYIGQMEMIGNIFSPNTDFGKKLHAVGQKDGDAWCSLFGELVAKEADPTNFKIYDSLFSASAVQTFKNFRSHGYKIIYKAQPDTIVVWQRFINGKESWQGHLGITDTVLDNNMFNAIEGNSNEAGAREGKIVNSKLRSLAYHTENGLRLLGFIKL